MTLWSREPSVEALRQIEETIRAKSPAATAAEVASLMQRYGRGLAEELDRQVQQRRFEIKSGPVHNTSPLPVGLSVLLQADPNLDFRLGTPQREALVPGRWLSVRSISEAAGFVKDFIWAFDLGGGNWTGGKLARDGVVFAKIAYSGRITDIGTGAEINAKS